MQGRNKLSIGSRCNDKLPRVNWPHHANAIQNSASKDVFLSSSLLFSLPTQRPNPEANCKGMITLRSAACKFQGPQHLQAPWIEKWIDTELQRLEREIERANEKGWRREMLELMDQKKLLSTSAERQRRLEEVPEVTPDTEEEKKETESEAAAKKSMQGNRGSKTGRAASMDMEVNSKGATVQVADSLEVAMETEESQEGATEQMDDSLKVVIEQSPEGATKQVADSLNTVIEESPEGASERGDATCEVASEDAGNCLCNGGTPGPGLHNQMHNAQDGGTTQAIDTDNGKDEDGPRHHNGGDIVVIDSDSDEDKDLNPEPECVARGAPEAMKGVAVPPRRASQAMDGVDARTGRAPVAMHTSTEDIAMWHYLDPQGQARGPFAMKQMRCWKQSGFFSDDFVVWRTGQTMVQAILLTDAMRLTFQCPPFPPRLAR